MLRASEKVPDFLDGLLQSQYGSDIRQRIEQAYFKKRATSLRVNPLKASKDEVLSELSSANIGYVGVSWYDDALVIEDSSESDIRALGAYESGKVYLQNLSSMLPPLILEPQPGQSILDMAAAPGGKTAQIAALTMNKCQITACEMNKIRASRLSYNLQKLGVSCAYVMVTDSRKLDNFFSFDKILLDAPCSGSGTLTMKDLSDGHFTRHLIDKCTASQKALLAKAVDLLKPGCEMVYSTCSVLKEENEDVVEWALRRKDIELAEIDFSGFGDIPVIPSRLGGTVTVCPDGLYEGFFMAKLKKAGSSAGHSFCKSIKHT